MPVLVDAKPATHRARRDAPHMQPPLRCTGFGKGKGDGGKGKGKGKGGGFGYSEGPPDAVVEIGVFEHSCEGDLVVRSTNEKVPYFNAPIYLENKNDVGKVDEIFGTIQMLHFSVKPGEGMPATSFKAGDKLYINPEKLLPLQRFLPQPKGVLGSGTKGKGGSKGKGKGGGKGKGDGKGKGKGIGKGKGSPGKGKGKGK